MIPTCRADVKSDEEWRMILWLHEATDHGMVVRWEYEPESFVLFPKGTYKAEKKLKTKTKVINRFLHHPATYTPDFVIEFSTSGWGISESTSRRVFPGILSVKLPISTARARSTRTRMTSASLGWFRRRCIRVTASGLRR